MAGTIRAYEIFGRDGREVCTVPDLTGLDMSTGAQDCSLVHLNYRAGDYTEEALSAVRQAIFSAPVRGMARYEWGGF